MTTLRNRDRIPIPPVFVRGWDRMSSRERRLAVGTGAVVLLVAAWTLVWLPLQEDVPRTRAELQRDRAVLAAARAQVTEIAGLERSAQPQFSGNPRVAIERVTGERGFQGAVTSLEVKDKLANVTFAAISFDALVGFSIRSGRRRDWRSRRKADFARRTGRIARRSHARALTRSMKLIAVLVAFAVMVVVAAAAFAPATLLDMRLDAATQGQLRLTNAEGSVWNGKGRVTNAQRTWSLPVAWKFAPLEFARGGMAVALRDTGQGGGSRGNFTWRDGTLTAEGVALSVPSSAVSGAMAADNLVALGGTLALDASHFGWSGSGGDGAAMVDGAAPAWPAMLEPSRWEPSRRIARRATDASSARSRIVAATFASTASSPGAARTSTSTLRCRHCRRHRRRWRGR